MFKSIKNMSQYDCFTYVQPVGIEGFRYEVPTWINLNGVPRWGLIDALIRRPSGPDGGAFLVFELKRPDGAPPATALQQAIRYAIALDIETNGDNKRQGIYRALFGSQGNARLSFGAVAVIQDTQKNRNLAQAALQDYALPPDRPNRVDRLGVLLYEWQNNQVTNWRWLLGADPRH